MINNLELKSSKKISVKEYIIWKNNEKRLKKYISVSFYLFIYLFIYLYKYLI